MIPPLGADGATSGSLRSLLRLSLPIIGSNLGLVLMGVVDTAMVGRVSAEALAAVALGNVYSFALIYFGIGVLFALDPLVAQALGAGDQLAMRRAVQRGVIVAAILSLPLAALLFATAPILGALHQPAEVVPLAAVYCKIIAPGVLPFLLFVVGRQTLQAMHRVAPILWTIVAANVLNAALNFIFVFGEFGAPALGVAGSALATTVSRVVMVGLLLWLARRELGAALRPWLPESTHLRELAGLFKVGLPIGLQFEFEMAAFSIVALLMGAFGTIAVAGHQVAISLASFTFMVPMGVSMGAAVLVGQGVGAGDHGMVRAAARNALVLGIGVMALSAVLLTLFPRAIAGAYSTDAPVIAFASSLIPIAGVFQVFDGIQVVCTGILRGLGQTRAPVVINLVGFGVVGTSASLWLAFRTSLGAVGLWWGLVLGLMAVAAILYWRVRVALRAPLTRLVA